MAAGSDESQEKRKLIKHLVASIPCAVCQHYHEPDNVRIVDHDSEIWIMAIKCDHCGAQGLVVAMIQDGGKPEIVKELTSQEWARFREMPQIDADDVLDVHELLRDFDGDFVGLLEDSAR
ncbi:MAG: hypothetical protein H8E47_03110 [Anaerolineales bacterium]|nr:hypothetical protein [Anaerolineales bacterium]